MTDEKGEEKELSAESIRLVTLKGLERFAYRYSAAIFIVISIFGGVTIYLYGFFWNLQKGMASIIDTSFAANLTLQLTFLISLVGLIVRALPSIINALFLLVLVGEEDEVWAGAQKRVERATRFIFVPAVIFVALEAFLDFRTASLLSVEVLFLLFVLVSFIYLSERQLSNKKHYKEIFDDVRLTIRQKQFLSRYRRFPAVCIGIILVGLLLLGDAKFRSLIRQKPVDIYLEEGCLRAHILGATSNGVVVLGELSEARSLFAQFELVFFPFSRVTEISFSDGAVSQCNTSKDKT